MFSRIDVVRRLTHWLLTLGLLIGASSVSAFQLTQINEWSVETQAEVELGVATSALSRAGPARHRKNDLPNKHILGIIAPALPQVLLKAVSPAAELQSSYSKLHKRHGIFRI
jgi:hypothetical protein